MRKVGIAAVEGLLVVGMMGASCDKPADTVEVNTGAVIFSDPELSDQCGTVTDGGEAKALERQPVNLNGLLGTAVKIEFSDDVSASGDCGPTGWMLGSEPALPPPPIGGH